jgi:hypothetical protein
MELRLQIVGPLISKVRHNRDCSGNKRYVKEASQGNILFPFGGIRHNAGGTRYRCVGTFARGGTFLPELAITTPYPPCLQGGCYSIAE